MAKLYKRGKVWWFQFRGRRVSTRCSDRKAAELAAKEFERRTADPTYEPEDEATLDHVFTTFIAQQQVRGRAPGTIKMNRQHAGHFLRVMGRTTGVNFVESRLVDSYVKTRLKEEASRSTIQKELSTLRGCLTLAARHRHYRRDLIAVMPKGFNVDYKPRKTWLDLPDVMKLLGKLPAHRGAVVAWIVGTGSRDAEQQAASRKDVSKTQIRLRGTKTALSFRVVPRLKVFEELIAGAIPFLPFEPWTNIRRDLAVACKRAGVAKVTPNDLRRSCTTILRTRGVEPNLLALFLGHCDTRMVERVYGRMDAGHLGRLIETTLRGSVRRRRPMTKPSGDDS